MQFYIVLNSVLWLLSSLIVFVSCVCYKTRNTVKQGIVKTGQLIEELMRRDNLDIINVLIVSLKNVY